MTETAKKAPGRPRKTTGAVAGEGPAKRTVVTSTGTQELPEVTTPEDIKAAAVIEGPTPEDVAVADFADLDVEELTALAEFFVKDVVAVDDDNPSKSELLAALASSDEDGGQPVTWEDYQELFLPSRPSKSADAPQKEAGNPLEGVSVTKTTTTTVTVEEPVEEDTVLVKMERKNPRYDIAGYTFTQEHPFNAVPEKTAEFIVKSGGFRLVLPSEAVEYYN